MSQSHITRVTVTDAAQPASVSLATARAALSARTRSLAVALTAIAAAPGARLCAAALAACDATARAARRAP